MESNPFKWKPLTCGFLAYPQSFPHLWRKHPQPSLKYVPIPEKTRSFAFQRAFKGKSEAFEIRTPVETATFSGARNPALWKHGTPVTTKHSRKSTKIPFEHWFSTQTRVLNDLPPSAMDDTKRVGSPQWKCVGYPQVQQSSVLRFPHYPQILNYFGTRERERPEWVN